MTFSPRRTTVTPQRAADRPSGATAPLLVFAAVYVVPLAFAPSLWWSAAGLGVGVLVAAGSWLVARSDSRPVRRPSDWELRAVALTSLAEAVALVAAIATGIGTGAWWLALPLLLTVVTAHILSLGVAFRRAVDAWSAVWISAAALAVWASGAAYAAWTWPLCGAVAAAVCIGYVLALNTARRRGPLGADRHPKCRFMNRHLLRRDRDRRSP